MECCHEWKRLFNPWCYMIYGRMECCHEWKRLFNQVSEDVEEEDEDGELSAETSAPDSIAVS